MTYIILLLMKRYFSVQKLDSETIDKYIIIISYKSIN